MIREDERGRRDRRPSRPSGGGLGAWRLLWAVLGVLAYVGAKYLLTF